MARFILVVSLIVFGFLKPVAAQVYVQGGAYFGQQMAGCGNGISIPREIVRIEKKQRELEEKLENLEDDVEDLEEKYEEANSEYEEVREDITSWLKSDSNTNIAEAAMSHRSGEGTAVTGADPAAHCNSGLGSPWVSFCGGRTVTTPDPAIAKSNLYSQETHDWHTKYGTGELNSGKTVCTTGSFIAEKNEKTFGIIKKDFAITNRSGCGENPACRCATGLDRYAQVKSDRDTAENALSAKRAAIEDLERQIEKLEDKHDRVAERWQDDLAEGKTAAGYCYTCNNPGAAKVGVVDKLLGFTGVVAGAAATYFATKYAVDQNQKMGWGTSPWMPYAMGSNMLQMSMGYPFGGGGYYGGAFGGGAGAMGCTPGMGGYPGGGGPFGYPSPYFNPNAGSMMPGMYPGAGMMPGMYPGMYPAMGPNGVMNPFAMMMGPNGMPLMYPAGQPGMPGMPGMYPGGMPGMYPGGMPGMMGPNGMPLMYPAGMPGGMPGMFPGGMPGGMPGMFPGGMPGGMPGMYPGGMPGMMAPQYQQQMQQMYMQQLQGWMQQQQQMQQDYMNRMQIAGRLQMELVRIQTQIQQITGGMGMGGAGGMLGGGGLFGPGMGGAGLGFNMGVGAGGGFFGINGQLGLGGGGYLGGGFGGFGGYGAAGGGLVAPSYYNGDPNALNGGVPARGRGYAP